ncbi:MAG TPA: hypothetical protein VFD03_03560, partial [Clostridia bacterium]|nr:hypothetical protein [Clostridia bacterium]
ICTDLKYIFDGVPHNEEYGSVGVVNRVEDGEIAIFIVLKRNPQNGNTDFINIVEKGLAEMKKT